MTVLWIGVVVCILWLWTRKSCIPCNPRLKRADFGGFSCVCACLIALLPHPVCFWEFCLFVFLFVRVFFGFFSILGVTSCTPENKKNLTAIFSPNCLRWLWVKVSLQLCRFACLSRILFNVVHNSYLIQLQSQAVNHISRSSEKSQEVSIYAILSQFTLAGN